MAKKSLRDQRVVVLAGLAAAGIAAAALALAPSALAQGQRGFFDFFGTSAPRPAPVERPADFSRA